MRDVASGACCNFCEWSDPAALMVTRVEEVEGAQADESEGGRPGDVGGDT